MGSFTESCPTDFALSRSFICTEIRRSGGAAAEFPQMPPKRAGAAERGLDRDGAAPARPPQRVAVEDLRRAVRPARIARRQPRRERRERLLDRPALPGRDRDLDVRAAAPGARSAPARCALAA